MKAHMSMPEESSWGITIGKDPAPDVAKFWNVASLLDPTGICVSGLNPDYVDFWDAPSLLDPAGICVSGPKSCHFWDVAPQITPGTIGMESSGPGIYSTSAPYRYFNSAT